MRQIEKAAEWWGSNRPAAPGALRLDLQGALRVLAEHPGIGTKVENDRKVEVRRLYLTRIRYFIYYRVMGLAARRLHQGKFIWASGEVPTLSLQRAQLDALVLGLPWQRIADGGVITVV